MLECGEPARIPSFARFGSDTLNVYELHRPLILYLVEVKDLIDIWLRHSGVSEGKLFRRILKGGIVQGTGVTTNVVWFTVKRCARGAEIKSLAPHDLRRTCARLCHGHGGELEQIQFLLGHASVQTTERHYVHPAGDG